MDDYEIEKILLRRCKRPVGQIHLDAQHPRKLRPLLDFAPQLPVMLRQGKEITGPPCANISPQGQSGVDETTNYPQPLQEQKPILA